MNSQIKNKAVYWGTGRRKTSVARVRLIPGNGQIKINGRSGDDYLNFNPLHLNSIKAPLPVSYTHLTLPTNSRV